MIVSEAADILLSLLEQEDEEEYTQPLAIAHVQQALHEIAEENEFKFHNEVTEYTLQTPASGSEEDYWNTLPGRVPLTEILGSWANFAYIRYAWISVEDESKQMGERDLAELLNTFGDTEGVPESFAIDGLYFVWRKIAAAGTDYTIRLNWQKIPSAPAASDEPILLAQIPYGVIYRAAMIASVWLLDDNRVALFKALSQEAFERYNVRQSKMGDSPRSMEDYNG